MQLPEVCIRHPIFASILSIMVVLLGIVAFQKLEIQYFPEHSIHTASVRASVPVCQVLISCLLMSEISLFLPWEG